jgi:DNA repair protein RadA/Sms|tara:strand:- start:283 stop:651 length:369 start_codon:yes stop_codon:yes gene_type:complete
MVKTKTAFVCTDCGAEHGQWQGQCVACKAWNTLSQLNLGASSSPVTKADFRKPGYSGEQSNVQNLSDIDLQSLPRYPSSIGELDRVLGGGLVPGSVVLIGGNPGAGKSTLLLQVMCQLAHRG